MNTKETVRRTRAKTTAARSAARRPAPRKRMRTGADVVYTQPGPFNRNRFLLHLVSIIAVVLALTFGISLFFTVKHVEVYGAEKYTPWQIWEASGGKEGDSLLSISEARISSQIEGKLPYIRSVRVKVKLPDTVCIMVEELEVVYSVASDDGQWWLIRADGRVVDKTNAAEAERYTKLEGLTLTAPEVGGQAVATEAVPEATEQEEQARPVTVTGAERLATAITIMQYLEDNNIIGNVSSINLDNMNDLQLWYGDRFQVQLGDTTDLGYKITAMKLAINQMGDFQSGVLDASFTVDTGSGKKEVIYTPFS